jgi:hypothetical protein
LAAYIKSDPLFTIIPVLLGLKQGCPCSPLLFSLFFDRVYTFVKAALGGRTRSLGNTVISLLSFNLFMLMFADDVVIFSPTEEGLR